jgi:hypothetical protein
MAGHDTSPPHGGRMDARTGSKIKEGARMPDTADTADTTQQEPTQGCCAIVRAMAGARL